jgi:hypothetical protein
VIALRFRHNGDKIARDIGEMAFAVPGAAQRGLTRIVMKAHEEATKLLSGPGRKIVRVRKTKRGGKTRRRGQYDMLGGRPGSYPVPVVMGNLRRLLGYVPPDRTVMSNNMSFSAGRFEALLFDSAEYGNVIHEGKGSSEKYGPRRFGVDALRKVDSIAYLKEEIDKEIPRG